MSLGASPIPTTPLPFDPAVPFDRDTNPNVIRHSGKGEFRQARAARQLTIEVTVDLYVPSLKRAL